MLPQVAEDDRLNILVPILPESSPGPFGPLQPRWEPHARGGKRESSAPSPVHDSHKRRGGATTSFSNDRASRLPTIIACVAARRPHRDNNMVNRGGESQSIHQCNQD